MNRSIRVFRILALYMAALIAGGIAEVACAQTTSVASASGGIQMGGVALSQGTAVFVPVDGYGHPIAVTTSGGLNLPGSPQKPVGYLCSVSAGAISSCPIPDEVTSSPSGFCYNVTITDTTTFGHPTSGMSFLLPCVHGITGSTFHLDAYVPTVTVPTVAALTFTSGSGAPSSACTVGPCQYVDIAGHHTYFSAGGASWFELVGDTGAAGAAATVSLGTTTTGSPGSSAAVTNSGSSSAAVLNFTIPRGDTGATGANGTNGTNGTNGANGPPANAKGAWVSSGGASPYSAGDAVTFTPSGAPGPYTYVSLIGSNAGNQPDTSPTDWELIATPVPSTLTTTQLGKSLATAASDTLTPVRNLFAGFSGGLLNTDGTLDHGLDGSGYGHGTAYVAGLSTIVANQQLGVSSGPSIPAIAFYDALGGFISYTGTGASPITPGTPVTVPSNAVMAMFSLFPGNDGVVTATLMVVPGSSLPGSYMDYRYVDLSTFNLGVASAVATDGTAIARSIPVGFLDPNRQLFDQARAIDSTILDNTGAPYTTGIASGNYISPFVYIGDLTQITQNFWNITSGGGGATAFYDYKKNFISNTFSVSGAPPTTLTVPAGAVFVRFMTSTGGGFGALSTFSANGGASVISPSPEVVNSVNVRANVATALTTVQKSAQPFAGGTVFVTGDSIFGTHYMDAPLESILGVAAVSENDGGGGVPMVGAFDTEVTAFAANPTGPDVDHLVATAISGASLIIVEFGTNNGSSTLGSLSDAAGTPEDAHGAGTTFYGDCKMVADTLEAAIAINAPAVEPTIIVVTPYLQSRVTGTTLQNIITAEQQVFGGIYGYPVLDWATTSGINPTNWSLTTDDTIHINALGGKMAGAAIGHFANANAHQ